MTSSRLNAKARAYMKSHPGVNYTEALNAVQASNKQPLLGGAMSDMIGRILGAGTPAPDLETAMQNLGFEFPPNPKTAPPVAASDVRQGDVVKIGDRYGLIIKNDTALLDGKLVLLAEVANQEIEFYRMPAPPEDKSYVAALSRAADAAQEFIPLPYTEAGVSWERRDDVPLYGAKAGDILVHNGTASAYIGKGLVVTESGDTLPVSEVVTGNVQVLLPVFYPVKTGDGEPRGVSLLSIIGSDIEESWKRTELSEHLHVPLGYIPSNDHVFGIDIAEASRGGTGPHGVLQGKTGSGKSTLLHNVILAFAATYSPSRINLMVADFKVRAVSPALEALPHLVSAVGELDSDEEARKSFIDALNDEMSRRESFLGEHGARDSSEYFRMRQDRPDMPALPSLLVIVEELVEFLSYTSGTKDIRAALSRVLQNGRALGVHLLISSQHIDTATLGDVMSHMSYGISLAASAENFSRAVLGGSPEAAKLPVGYGDAIVRHSVHSESVLERIRAFPVVTDSRTASLVDRIVVANETWGTPSD